MGHKSLPCFLRIYFESLLCLLIGWKRTRRDCRITTKRKSPRGVSIFTLVIVWTSLNFYIFIGSGDFPWLNEHAGTTSQLMLYKASSNRWRFLGGTAKCQTHGVGTSGSTLVAPCFRVGLSALFCKCSINIRNDPQGEEIISF